MMKNVKAAITLNELKTRNVAKAILRNCEIEKASAVDRAMSPRLLPIDLTLIGLKSLRSSVDLHGALVGALSREVLNHFSKMD